MASQKVGPPSKDEDLWHDDDAHDPDGQPVTILSPRNKQAKYALFSSYEYLSDRSCTLCCYTGIPVGRLWTLICPCNFNVPTRDRQKMCLNCITLLCASRDCAHHPVSRVGSLNDLKWAIKNGLYDPVCGDAPFEDWYYLMEKNFLPGVLCPRCQKNRYGSRAHSKYVTHMMNENDFPDGEEIPLMTAYGWIGNRAFRTKFMFDKAKACYHNCIKPYMDAFNESKMFRDVWEKQIGYAKEEHKPDYIVISLENEYRMWNEVCKHYLDKAFFERDWLLTPSGYPDHESIPENVREWDHSMHIKPTLGIFPGNKAKKFEYYNLRTTGLGLISQHYASQLPSAPALWSPNACTSVTRSLVSSQDDASYPDWENIISSFESGTDGNRDNKDKMSSSKKVRSMRNSDETNKCKGKSSEKKSPNERPIDDLVIQLSQLYSPNVSSCTTTPSR